MLPTRSRSDVTFGVRNNEVIAVKKLQCTGCSRVAAPSWSCYHELVGATRREGGRPRSRLGNCRCCLPALPSAVLPMSLPNLLFSTLLPFCRPDVLSLFLLLFLFLAFSLLPHKSPSLTSHLSMIQATSDHSIRLPEAPIEPLVDHLMLPLVAPRSACCPQTLVPSSSCHVSAPAHPIFSPTSVLTPRAAPHCSQTFSARFCGSL